MFTVFHRDIQVIAITVRSTIYYWLPALPWLVYYMIFNSFASERAILVFFSSGRVVATDTYANVIQCIQRSCGRYGTWMHRTLMSMCYCSSTGQIGLVIDWLERRMFPYREAYVSIHTCDEAAVTVCYGDRLVVLEDETVVVKTKYQV